MNRILTGGLHPKIISTFRSILSGILFICIGALGSQTYAASQVVDNTDIDFSSSPSTWPSSTFSPGFYGPNYQYAGPGAGTMTATWTFNIGTTGDYEIFAQWTSHSNRAPDAPYTIKNNGNELSTVTVNQRINGGQFNQLGTGPFALEAGTLEVVLTNVQSGYVVADAVKIVSGSAGGNLAIITPSDLDLVTSPNVSEDPVNVLFKASATGFASDWEVEFSLDDPAFNTPVLGETCNPPEQGMVCKTLQVLKAEHTIYVRMVDGGGTPQPITDQVDFGVGDAYVGVFDSISGGSGDDDPSDNTSLDGRNSGGGYEPILNDNLTAAKSYPHTVLKDAISGDTSARALNRIPDVLADNPEVQYVVILVGSNDSGSTLMLPSGEGLNPPVIVDNIDPDFSSSPSPWPASTFSPGFYGTNYQYASPGAGTMTATWMFNIGTAGDYEIYAQWTAHSNRAPDAPYAIKNNGNELSTVTVNQRINGGQFNQLGTGPFALEAGTLEVVLTNVPSGYVIADAVQVVQPGYVGTYKDNLQQIVTAILQAGKIPVLMKVPFKQGECGSMVFWPDPENHPQNLLIQEYNVSIDEVRITNGITTEAPDTYEHFRLFPEDLFDGCHPDGGGYRWIGDDLERVLTQ